MSTLGSKLLKVLAVILMLLSLGVSIPLTIKTWRDGGGPWGFGVVGFPVLIPLSAYVLFGIAGLQEQVVRRRELFVGALIVTLVTGIATFFLYPVYPVIFSVIPVLLSVWGIVDKRHCSFLLTLMIVLAIVANILLLKWEFDFNRTLPLLQLF